MHNDKLDEQEAYRLDAKRRLDRSDAESMARLAEEAQVPKFVPLDAFLYHVHDLVHEAGKGHAFATEVEGVEVILERKARR